MKITVIGGYGVFGGRLVQLLRRDGHEVTVAGRDLARAQRFASAWGAQAMVLDRSADLSPLTGAEVVVDAAGPFHAYGDDPYRLARFCIDAGINYLDLSDNAAFCAGISVLDANARKAGVFALSGVSSVPALSAAAATALAQDMETIDTISSAILPGNRAPRGRSVVDSILSQTGLMFDQTTDSQTTPVRSWSAPRTFTLPSGELRKGWLIEVPDQSLFPAHFKARSVQFRAGLELPVMNYGLAVLSRLRERLRFGMPRWLVALVMFGARLLAPFGTDRGGMVVAVIGRKDGAWQRAVWRLGVDQGEGPFIPAVPARALLRNPAQIALGARPALGDVTLPDAEAAMADLCVTTTRDTTQITPLFPATLGAPFATLAPEIRATHDTPAPRIWQGRASVTRGAGVLPRLAAFLFRFPQARDDTRVQVTKTPVNGTEVWQRRFGTATFQSTLRATPQGIAERFGALTFLLDLHVAEGRLHYPIQKGWCLGIPIPRFALPKSAASERVENGRFHFDVRLSMPVTGQLIVHYQGWLQSAADFSGTPLAVETDRQPELI